MKIDTLILAGSSSKGSGYIGSLWALYEYNLVNMKNITLQITMPCFIARSAPFLEGAMKTQVLLPPPSSGESNRFLRVTTDVSTRSFPTRRFELCDFQFFQVLKF